jgi:hypothetical protein
VSEFVTKYMAPAPLENRGASETLPRSEVAVAVPMYACPLPRKPVAPGTPDATGSLPVAIPEFDASSVRRAALEEAVAAVREARRLFPGEDVAEALGYLAGILRSKAGGGVP